MMAADQLARAGVLFVPMPCRNLEEMNALLIASMEKLDQIANEAEEVV